MTRLFDPLLRLALLTVLCSACAPAPDPLARLDALLEARAYEDLLAATETVVDDSSPAWLAAHEQELRRYLILGSAGLGDCGPAEDLLDDPAPGMADRRIASLASEAASLAVLDDRAGLPDITYLDHRSGLVFSVPVKPSFRRESSLKDPAIVAWNDRVHASECVLDEARRRFPAAADKITEKLELVRAERIDEEALSEAMSSSCYADW